MNSSVILGQLLGMRAQLDALIGDLAEEVPKPAPVHKEPEEPGTMGSGQESTVDNT